MADTTKSTVRPTIVTDEPVVETVITNDPSLRERFVAAVSDVDVTQVINRARPFAYGLMIGTTGGAGVVPLAAADYGIQGVVRTVQDKRSQREAKANG